MWFLNKHLPWINAASTSRTSVVALLFLCLFICPFCCSFLFCFVFLVVCLFVFKLTNSISYSVNPAKESATFWIRFPEWKFLNTLWIRNRVDTKSGFFFFIWWWIYCIQDGNLVPRLSQDEARCKFRALYDAGSVANIPRGVLGTKMNPDTFRIRFDLNTIRVDVDIFESGKKKLRIQKYLDTCGRGLRWLIKWNDSDIARYAVFF